MENEEARQDSSSAPRVAVVGRDALPSRIGATLSGPAVFPYRVASAADFRWSGTDGVVFGSGAEVWERDLLVASVVSGLPTLVGPGAGEVQAFAWQLKPGVDAAGGILEIAGDDAGFLRRLEALVRAAALRGSVRRRNGTSGFAVNEGGSPYGVSTVPESSGGSIGDARSLVALPGVVVANRDLRSARSGRLDAERVRECFGLRRTEMARCLGVTAEALRQTPDAPRHREELGHFERIAAVRVLFGDPADFRKWLQSPNVELEGRSPGDLIREGGASLVADLVHDILEGVPG